jgi:tetratricopeptide (TPR) repeat protein
MTKLPSMINHRSRATTNRQFWIVIIVGILGGCLVTFHNKIANAFRFPVYGQKPKLSLSSPLFMALSREDEIRRKIRQLKKEGRLSNKSGTSASPDARNNDDDIDVDDVVYSDKIRRKLGKAKSQLLGYGIGNSQDDQDLQVEQEFDQVEESVAGLSSSTGGTMTGQMGTRSDLLERRQQQSTASYLDSLQSQTSNTSPSERKQRINIDPSIFDKSISTEPEPPEMTQDELLELVAQKLAEKRAREEKALEAAARVAREKPYNQTLSTPIPSTNKDTTSDETTSDQSDSFVDKRTTTGVGGTWTNNEKITEDMYKPKSGSWGAFPRPRDISKTYGGGRRVGAGFSKEDDAVANMKTQRLLKDYRRKVGIEVPTEQEHAAEIDEALKIGQLAMQRGIYATAVSALEKVTQWCSTNSKVGSKVYLELAMAYEALGRTKEAYQVYKTLSDCRMEDVKHNARRLLYGMEAMEIMRDVSSDFSRTKTRNTFIDATGLATIAQNFDDVYNTAYIDLDGGFYKKLTESVVRSNREARQILLKATGKGAVGRTRVVQALRCISRQFDECLQSELATTVVEEPTAFLNGKPIVKGAPTEGLRDIGDFQLLSPEEMIQNLDGKWRLQLLADKSGDGVSYFNTTVAVQEFSTENMTFEATGPSGFVTVQSSGKIEMENKKRILSRYKVETSGTGAGGLFGLFQGGKDSGFPAAVSRTQQIISVDSVLLITKCAPGSRKGRDGEKEHFAVWRRDSVDQTTLL